MDISKGVVKTNMLVRFKNFLNDKKIDILLIALLGTVAYLLAYIFLGLAKTGLDVPYGYYGEDDFSELVATKLLGEQFWSWYNPRVAAPFGNYAFDFLANMFNGFDLLLTKLFYLFTNNFAVAFNLRYLAIFPLSAIISYTVLRALGLNYVFSAFGGLVYSLSPYIFYRGVIHLSLSTCYFIPLSILLCVWAMADKEPCLKFERCFFKKPKNWLIILFAMLIANNGIGYYAFLTCFFLCIVAVCNLLNTKDLRSVLPPIKIIGCILVFFVIALAPALIFKLTAEGHASGMLRGSADAEIYGLKIMQLLLPLDGNGIGFLQEFIDNYNAQMPLVNENRSAYLGIAGICGLAIALVSLFKTKREENGDSTVGVLVRMTVFGILFATVGGFSSIVGVIVPFLRGFNRISIFLLFICLYIFLVTLQGAWDKLKDKVKWKKICAICGFAIFTAICVFDLLPAYGSNDAQLAANEANFKSDAAFVEQIEKELGKDARVYQLPYHKYPESGPVNAMADYHLYTGFIHSDTLKWSYGGTKGRDSDLWCEYVNNLDTAEMINYICRGGFTGIYIDARAYSADGLASLKGEIENVTGTTPLVSANGNLIFYNLKAYISTNGIVYDKSVYDMEYIGARKQYPIDKLHVSGDGEKLADKIVVRKGATQFGPYCDVEAGEHLIAFYGEGLENGSFMVVTDYGKNFLNVEKVYSSDGVVIVKVRLDKYKTLVEYRTYNGTDKELSITGVKTLMIDSKTDIEAAKKELLTR